MSQPPNQPPQGGFGAPQDPQKGAPQPPAQPPQMPQAPPTPPQGQPPQQQPGYGYPQAPPPQAPQPGYGYPAQPGGRPQAGPYGQPQQPGPYGQPQTGPYGQPQQPGPYGGYPTQQQHPGAPAPGGGGGSFFKGKPAAIIGGALAAVLLIGVGVYFAVGDDGDGDKKPIAQESQKKDDKPTGEPSADEGDGEGTGRETNDDLNAGRQPGEAKVLWLKTNEVDMPRGSHAAYGPWFTGDVVVQALYKTVTAFDVNTGKKKWEVPFENELCAAPRNATTSGKLVVGVKDGKTDKAKCNQLRLVDLVAGKAGWKTEVKKENLFDGSSSMELAISGDTVTASRWGVSSAYRIADGAKAFGDLKVNGCGADSFAGGGKLIAVDSCGTDGKAQQVREVNSATGAGKWTFPVPKGWQVKRVYSVDPVVLYLTNEEKKAWNVTTLKADGSVRSQLDTKESIQPQCGWAIIDDNLQGCLGTVADANTLYLPTEEEKGGADGFDRTNKVIAFNLNTGKEKWSSPAGKDRTMLPVRMEGSDVLAYVQPSYDHGGGIVSIGPGGGAPKSVLKSPESTAEIENGFSNRGVSYTDGRLFITPPTLTGRDDEEGEKTMMVFGK
ncbi:PQQ-binding-like beta-propeller repeat protein [Streptomyces sp. H27-C3]|uniref:outer membrane protein assembly factor BamB family protein n=1 Tax=Streptomyces sp. H27-C3 TaxID=3046305 RepID=UPI0024B978B2|nr:PQQ-binding-like beta-propeller repeat protein [Streptomyces sp. H27-C3]MDJ0460490.1 PQQ-binding-like beta-propeller repeat protein [Streptomyces sp. H27-C3]